VGVFSEHSVLKVSAIRHYQWPSLHDDEDCVESLFISGFKYVRCTCRPSYKWRQHPLECCNQTD